MGLEVESTVLPLVSWSLKDAYEKDSSHMHLVYKVLKEYIQLELINIETRHSTIESIWDLFNSGVWLR